MLLVLLEIPPRFLYGLPFCSLSLSSVGSSSGLCHFSLKNCCIPEVGAALACEASLPFSNLPTPPCCCTHVLELLWFYWRLLSCPYAIEPSGVGSCRGQLLQKVIDDPFLFLSLFLYLGPLWFFRASWSILRVYCLFSGYIVPLLTFLLTLLQTALESVGPNCPD